MILMYHHVCPSKYVPQASEVFVNEGWLYNIDPGDFDKQLKYLIDKGFRFYSMADYVARCNTGTLAWRDATITFDDGWIDNYSHAFPVLEKLSVSACFFVVSGSLPAVPSDRRMSDSHLQELIRRGMTVGAHSKSHANLTSLSKAELLAEVCGCKTDLENRLGLSIDFFAYPGGRFNRRVADVVKDAGFQAACSVLNGGYNDPDSIYWLFRDVLEPSVGSVRNRVFLNPVARKFLDVRAQRRLRMLLDQ